MVEHLDKHLVGKAATKRTLAVAASTHFRRLADGERRGGRLAGPDPLADAPGLSQVVVERSNVLPIRPSGSGKTRRVNSLAERLTVPVVVGDATTFTVSGDVGADEVGDVPSPAEVGLGRARDGRLVPDKQGSCWWST